MFCILQYMIKIRKAKKEDLNELLETYLSYLTSFNSFNKQKFLVSEKIKSATKKQLKEIIQNQNFLLLVVLDNKELIGFINCSVHKKGFDPNRKHAFVNDIFIKKPYRKKGIASNLMKKAITWAKKRGAKEIKLGSNIKNKEALALWPKLGFKKFMIEFRMDLR